MFDLILVVPSVLTNITAYYLPLFQWITIAFQMFIISVGFILSPCAVFLCSLVYGVGNHSRKCPAGHSDKVHPNEMEVSKEWKRHQSAITKRFTVRSSPLNFGVHEKRS